MFKGIFATNSAILSSRIEDNTLILDFNAAFADYDPAIELKLIESMAYVFTQFEGIDFLRFTIESNEIDRMPKAQTTIIQPMSRDVGFNIIL